MHRLAIGAIFREETHWLREWLEYHRLVGVEHFYLLDNDDPPERERTRPLFAPYLEAGLVTLIDWPSRQGDMANQGYRHLLTTLQKEVDWLALLDLDEFALPLVSDDLRTCLEPYERPGIACLQVSLATFGSSGLEKTPPLATEAFVRRAQDTRACNWTSKNFVRLSFPGPRSAHHSVDEDLRPAGPISKRPWPQRRLRVNHYATRSLECWRRKVARGWPPGRPGGDITPDVWAHKFAMVHHNEVEDTLIQRFLPSLKEKLS